MANDPPSEEIKDETSEKQTEIEVEDLEWSADKEILLLYSLHGYKPVGLNKHFRMLLIQDRLSNAMNKNISSKAIWKKLNTLYDLEALDEAEAEADAAVAVDITFSLPEDEFGELMAEKVKSSVKQEKSDTDIESDPQEGDLSETKLDHDSEVENNKETDSPKSAAGKEIKKEPGKRGPKKKDANLIKDNVSLKKDNVKEALKKDTPTKKDLAKETKKGSTKDDEKKETVKKNIQELKKDNTKEDKKEVVNKVGKRDASKITELSKKEIDIKKGDQKKTGDVSKTPRMEGKPRAETPKQIKTETPKRAETKTQRAETPKPNKSEATPKPQRVEALKKDSSAEKKKDASEKKVERKSPEKTHEPARGAKLRMREKKEVESDKPETPTGTKRERSRDSTSKADTQTEETPAKKVKTPAVKGRPTRNSLEPVPKPASPGVNPLSPQKRRTRMQ